MAVEYIECISTNECPIYDVKQSDAEVLVMEIWGMGSTLSLSLHTEPLCPSGVGSVSWEPMSEISILIGLLQFASYV